MFVDVCPRKLEYGLCQNCVRYSAKPRLNIVIHEATSMHIAVAGKSLMESALVRVGVR
jgi:hypothetical protein